jgi:hypothetical protein
VPHWFAAILAIALTLGALALPALLHRASQAGPQVLLRFSLHSLLVVSTLAAAIMFLVAMLMR